MGRRNSRRAISKGTAKKKSASTVSETLIPCKERLGKEDNETGATKEGKGGFFACYLLTSLSPRHKGRTYIGFTVNPRRRIRQHNGEIGSGASRTKSGRPWGMVFCIYGFPTHVSALQFEWAWQHPKESLAVREAAATLKSLTGLANKIKLGYTMLTLPTWENLKLTVNFFSTKYTIHSAGCPSLPKHMGVQICSLDELPCYTKTGHNPVMEDEDESHDEMCKSPSFETGSRSEGLTVAEFGDWRTIEEVTCNKNGVGIQESISRRQSGDLLSSTKGEKQHPLFAAPTPVNKSSSVTTSSFAESEGSKNRDYITLTEGNNGVELHRPVRAADYYEPSILTSVFPREIDVIDLLSPSPGTRSEGSTVAGFSDWRTVEEITSNQDGIGIEEAIGRRPSGDFLSLTEGDRPHPHPHPHFTTPTPVRKSSSVTTSSSSVSDNREAVILIEENDGVEPEPDRLVRAVEYDEPSHLTSVFPCEVDVINLLSPSPRIWLASKKRKVSDVSPEKIDLTKSPIVI